MIQVTNLHKHYGDTHVLKGVSFEVSKAELVAITGSSGAGKTTLLQIMGTLDAPDTHEDTKLTIGGAEPFKLNKQAFCNFRNQSIGFIFQFHNLIPELTAVENVMLPSLIKTKDKKLAKQEAMELLDYLGIADKASSKPNVLSGGQQQRIAIARALVNKPAVVLADEPTGNLDAANSDKIYELFAKLSNDLKQTIITVTHDSTLAQRMDRVLPLANGTFCNYETNCCLSNLRV